MTNRRNTSKTASQQSRKVVKENEKSNKSTSLSPTALENSSDDDDDATFQSAATVTDQSAYSLDYSNKSAIKEVSRNQQQQTNTSESKESTLMQNKQQNHEPSAANSKMGMMLTTSLYEVETDDEDDLTTSAISNQDHQISKSSSKRESVDRNEVLPNPVKAKTQRNSRKITKPIKKNTNDVITAYRQTTTNIMPKKSFQRLAVEIARQRGDYRFTKEALNALQESAELYLTHLFEDAFRLALHRKAITLHPQDMKLVLYLRGNVPGNY